MQNERETHTEHRVGVDILVQKRGMGMVVDLDRWFWLFRWVTQSYSYRG